MPTAAATGPCSTNADAGVLTYRCVEEVVTGAATLLHQVPVVGDVCASFLSLNQLVETARSNKEDLANLSELCDVVIKGVLDKRSEHSCLLKGFVCGARKTRDKSREEVSKLCNGVGIKGSVKRCVLARKISNDIAAAGSNIVSFAIVNNLTITNDLHVSMHIGRIPVVGLNHMQRARLSARDLLLHA